MFWRMFEYRKAEYWDEFHNTTKQVDVVVNFPPSNWTFRDFNFQTIFYLFTDDGDILTIPAYHRVLDYQLYKTKVILGMCLQNSKPGIDFLIHGDYFAFPEMAQSIHPVSENGEEQFFFDWMGQGFEAIIDNTNGYSYVQLVNARWTEPSPDPLPETWWGWYDFENRETWKEYVQNGELMFYYL